MGTLLCEDLSSNADIRRRKPGISSSALGSDLEDTPPPQSTGTSTPTRKKFSIHDNLTVFCDDQTTPEQTPLCSLKKDPLKIPGLFEFFWEELTRGYSLHNDESRYSEKRRKVYAFLNIPLELERFLFFGLLQCIDAFLYLFTFLPIRFIMSIIGFICRIRRWTSAETCDFLKVAIILVSSLLMQYIDTSVVYHQVRSQGVIKLYIFYNMLEVADKLFSSFGQDVLDSLFWTANERPMGVRTIVQVFAHYIFAVAYASLHTLLVLLQATTLNVAFNSHNQAILAIMMSNNFVELKGSVFKKFAKANLFQMACSDVRERFHIMSLLFVVIVRNMMAVNWSVEHLTEMVPDLLLVVGAELLVDWLKHAFITKFNEINANVYRDFTITISYDVVRSRDSSAFSDYSDQVSRRMGFIPIPLSIMLIRVLSQTFSFQNKESIIICAFIWLLLLAVKVCNGIVLLGQACAQVIAFKDLQARAEYELYRKRMLEKKSKSAPNSPRMSLVDFSDVVHQVGGVKGFTFSDLLGQLEELQLQSVHSPDRRDSDRERSEQRSTGPRRTQSLAHMSRPRRDKSEPPPSIPEAEEKGGARDEDVSEKDNDGTGQISPKKKTHSTTSTTNDDLADVTAYTMLPADQGVQRIE